MESTHPSFLNKYLLTCEKVIDLQVWCLVGIGKSDSGAEL